MTVPILKWVSDPSHPPHSLSPFEVSKKDRVFISGPSGCGKTTFFRRLVRLHSHFEDRVEWMGQPLSPQEIMPFRKKCLCLPQHFSRTPESLSAWLDRRFQRSETLGYNFKASLTYLLEWSQTKWSTSITKPLTDFSGGELQSIILCAALNLKPNVLILDESTSALDFDTEARFWSLINQEDNKDLGILWTSHHPHPEFIESWRFRKLSPQQLQALSNP